MVSLKAMSLFEDVLLPLLDTPELNKLLEGYVDSLSEGERSVAKDYEEQQEAIALMMMNIEDETETFCSHLGFVLKSLIGYYEK